MAKFLIRGGKKLSGKISISGSKNAVLALIPAALLIDGKIIFRNVPEIDDARTMIKILKFLGAEVEFGDNELVIDTRNIGYRNLLIEEIKMLRASILFLGPFLARFKKISCFLPGGDVIGARPIDTHIKGLNDLGAIIDVRNNKIEGKLKKIKQQTIILKEISVTGSEVLIMASAFSQKPINLKLVALEPHVQSLCEFLKKAGFKIDGIGTHFLKVSKGEKIKKEVIFDVPYDYIEAGTFLALGPVVKDKIVIENAPLENLDSVFVVAKEMNINFELKKGNIIIKPSKLKGTKIQTGVYPKFPSDLQSPFGVMATQAEGVTLIQEWMYENRFGYLKEIQEMGANIEILDPHRSIIIGPTFLHGSEVRSLDIRAGISLILAGIYADGETLIHEAEKIDRGYEKIEIKLKNLGVEIERLVN